MKWQLRNFPLLLLSFLVIPFGLAQDQGDNPQPTIETYRNQAVRGEGDPVIGQKLFHDERTLCSQCHSVDGSQSAAGPDLFAAGDKFSRADLVESILNPSDSIMTGFATSLIETQQGDQFIGVLKSLTDSEIVLAGIGDVRHRIPKGEIKSRQTLDTSFMPLGLHAGLTPEEFTNLVAYLEQLKQPELKLVHSHGTPAEIPSVEKPISLIPVNDEATRFENPVWFGEHPDHNGFFFVAERANAQIWLLDTSVSPIRKSLFVNLRDEIYVAPDQGLLGMCLHPEFANNRRFYFMHESMNGEQPTMTIAARLASEDGLSDSGEPSTTILTYEVPTKLHHGGGVEFGPDGYLYIGMGDSGPQGDPLGHGQDLTKFFGKILRIDVDKPEDEDSQYSIPATNPFLHREEALPEIYAYGFRQPWRFSFDPANDDLWVGDVGQTRFEEVCIVKAGENHGWNVHEGFDLYSTKYRNENAHYTPPVISFRRKFAASITGGYVFRQNQNSSYYGTYICADYQTRRIWGLTQNDRKLVKIRQIGTSPDKIASFGQDNKGNIYILGYNNGLIHKLDFSPSEFK